ncbi:MAG TPA: flippase-like domain-containing protein [bacterium]|nr:flippase-like domain-containing protein [bacterium]
MTRTWILRFLIVAFIWFAISRLTEVESLVRAFLQARWEWILPALAVQALYFIVTAAMYQSAFATVGVRSRSPHLLPILLASVAVNVATTGAGFGGAALFVDDSARRGESPGRTAVGVLLALIADLTAFMIILVPGVVVLFVFHTLRAYEVVAAAMLVALVGALGSVMLVGLWRPRWIHFLLSMLQKIINRIGARFGRPELVSPAWVTRSAEEFAQATFAIAAHPLRLVRTVGLALGAHLLDLVSLYTVALAFRARLGLGPLVAGYAMAIVFWNVSITPQGIGVVEGVMTLVYTSLGFPPEQATLIALGFRGLTLWLPMAVGFAFLRRLRSFAVEVETRTAAWSVRGAALLTAAMGVVNVLSAVLPALPQRLVVLERFSPLSVRHGAHAAAALAGFALLLLALGLWRRKRMAWALSLGVLAVSVVSHLLKGLDYEEAGLAALLGAWLVMLRWRFQARSDPPSVHRGLAVVAAAFLFALTYGTAGFYLLDRHFRIDFDLWAAVRQTVLMFTAFRNPGLEPITGFGRNFADSIYLIAAVTVGFALFALLRPVLLRRPASPFDHERARVIVERYGRSSFARLVLFPDKQYYFSLGGSMVSYTIRGRAALALGDPIGPEPDAPETIRGFQAYCQGNDWLPGFYQTLPDYLGHYEAAGFQAMHIGDEGSVILTDFSLEGKAGKSLRGAVNRLARLGHQAVLHEPPLADTLLEELRVVSDQWLTMMHGREKGFSLGWFEDDYIRHSHVMAVHAADGTITAFANIVSEYQRDEITIDLMRRRPTAEGGTMDLLFVHLLEWAKAQGYASFSLGLSPLAGVGLRSEDPIVERALHYLYEHVNQFYNFKGLHAFKEKFRPQWSPRYLVYPGAANLPAVALAVIRADSGDQFVWDYVKDFWARRTAN